MNRNLASGSALALGLALIIWGGMACAQHLGGEAGMPPQLSANPAAPSSGSNPTIPVPDQGFALYFSGNRQGNLEPCGCHTKQQGGLYLEASLYAQQKGETALRVDAGEWVNPAVKRLATEPMKAGFLLRGLRMMDFEAINMGMLDVQLSTAWFDELRRNHPEAVERMISANTFLKEDPEKLAFAPSRIVKQTLRDGSTINVGIIGATSLQGNLTQVQPVNANGAATTPTQEVQTGSFILRDCNKVLPAAIAELRPKVDLLLLLYAGDFSSTYRLAQQYPTLDVIVTSGRNVDNNSVFLREGNVLMFFNPSYQGKEVGRAVLARTGKAWQPQGQGEKMIVSKELPREQKLVGLIEEYKKATQTIAAEMPPPNAPQVWAGDDKCITCHLQVHNQWKTTPHSNAMETLVEVNQQFNPDCVSCHVTGYKNANGFWHITDLHSQLYMANVQCEVCHGPAQQHATDQQMIQAGAEKWMQPMQFAKLKESAQASLPKAQVPESVCLQCHTQVTDPEFSYAKKVEWINHSKPYDATAAGHAGNKMHGMQKGMKIQPGPTNAAPTTATAPAVNPAAGIMH